MSFAACWCLLCFLFITDAHTLRNRYFATVEEDSITYHSVRIPSNAFELKLKIWIDSALVNHKGEPPKLLLKYDGIPTVDDNDGVFDVPPSPDSLLIVDAKPTMAQLYMGLWGGKLLHSNRYFAGSAVRINFGIDSAISVCTGLFIDGVCKLSIHTLPLILYSSIETVKILSKDKNFTFQGHGSIYSPPKTSQIESARSYSVIIGEQQLFSTSFPSRIELVVATFTFSSNEVEKLCSHSENIQDFNATKTMLVKLFRDEDDDEDDSGSKYIDFSCPRQCIWNNPVLDRNNSFIATKCNSVQLQMSVEHPRYGSWKVAVEVGYKSQKYRQVTNPNPKKWIFTDDDVSQVSSETDSTVFTRQGNYWSSGSNQHDHKGNLGYNPGGEDSSIEIELTGYMCPPGRTGYSNIALIESRWVVLNTKSTSRNFTESSEHIMLHCMEEVVDMTMLTSVDAPECVAYSTSGEVALRSLVAINNSFGMHVVDSTSLDWASLLSLQDATIAIDKNNLTIMATSRRASAVYSAAIDQDKIAMGGVMTVSAMIRVQSSDLRLKQQAQPQGKFQMDKFPFAVAFRCGGLPSEPFFTLNSHDNLNSDKPGRDDLSQGEFERFSANALILSSSQADEDIDCNMMLKQPASARNVYYWNDPFQASSAEKSWQRVASDWFQVLFSDDSDGDDIQNGTLSDDNSNEDESQLCLVFTWQIAKPRLPGIASGELFARLVSTALPRSISSPSVAFPKSIMQNMNRKLSTSNSMPSSQKKATSTSTSFYDTMFVSLSIQFAPCSIHSCQHGFCVEEYGSIVVSSCVCKYPWAGEHCDALSVTSALYVIQIAFLVISNLSMLPSIYFTYQCNQLVLMMVLLSSMVFSILYHFCDTDAWCIAGIDFRSLQVADNLFCILSIMGVITYFAPVSPSLFATLILGYFALLLSPVTNSPTNPLNGIIGALIAIGTAVCCWGYEYSTNRDTIRSRVAYNRVATHDEVSDGLEDEAALRSRDDALMVNDIDKLVESNLENSNDEEQSQINTQTSTDHMELETFPNVDNSSFFSDLSAKSWKMSIVFLSFFLRHRHLVVGLLLVMGGILSFVFQNKDNYYILHSLWHVAVMYGGYLLISSRNKVSHYLFSIVGNKVVTENN